MSALRERTNYFKTVDGVVVNFDEDGGWVDVTETIDGGAIIKPQMEILDFLDCLWARSMKETKNAGEFSVELCSDGTLILREKNGEVMPFNKVMSVVFD